MHFRRAILLVIVSTLLISICCAQQIDVYLSALSTRSIPQSGLDSSYCSSSQPCTLAGSGSGSYLYFDDLSINLIFVGDSYTVDEPWSFGTSGNLTVTSLGTVTISGSSSIHFGNNTHRVGHFEMQDAEWTIGAAGLNTWSIFAESSVRLSNVDASISTVIAPGVFVDVSLGYNAVLEIESVTFEPSVSASHFLTLEADTIMDRFLVSDCTLAQSSDADFYIADNLTKISTLEMTDIEFGAGSQLFELPSGSPYIQIDDFIMTGCDFGTRAGTLSSIEPLRVHLADNFFGQIEIFLSPPDAVGEIFESWYNEFSGGIIISIFGYSEFDLFGNIYRSTEFAASGADTIWAQYEQVYDVHSYALAGASYVVVDSSYFADSRLYLGGGEFSASEAYLTYSIFERFSSSYYSTIAALDITFYETEFYDYSGSLSQMVEILSIEPYLDPIPIYGNAIIMGLSFSTDTSVYINYGYLSVINNLYASINATIYNSGILSFIAHPETGAAVDVAYVDIKGPYDPQEEESVIALVAWKAGDLVQPSALTINGCTLDPSDHILVVLIENGDLADAVNGSKPVVLASGNAILPNNFSVVYPSDEFEYDAELGFTGFVTMESPSGQPTFLYHITDFTCPNDCSGNGECAGVNTCSCNPTYSGYSCGCHNLPANIYCRDDQDNFWATDSDLSVDDTSSFEFPDGTGGNVNGSLINYGRLILKDATYDVNGALSNNGQMTIVSTISQVRNTTVGSSNHTGCVFVPTSRSFAKRLELKPGSNLTVELDLASATTSTCPNGTPSIVNPAIQSSNSANMAFAAKGRRRDPKRETKAFLNERRASFGMTSMRAVSATATSSAPISKAAKSKALLEADSGSLSGGTMIVNLKSAPTETIEITLVATRNNTAPTVPLLVQVNAPSGTCTSISNKPNLVSLIASPCATAPTESPDAPANNNKGGVKWYYYVAPILALFVIGIVLVILAMTVPAVGKFFNPYKGAN